MASIIITIPASTPWTALEAEFKTITEDPSQVKKFKVPSLPIKSRAGDKCYLVHKGQVKGYLVIQSCDTSTTAFRCTTTGTVWPAGKYLNLAAPFTPVEGVAHKGFQGYHYYNE